MAQLRAAFTATGAKLLVCVGGNGRSRHFAAVTRDSAKRALFVTNLRAFVQQHQLDGVDVNWEYPGFAFGSGYGFGRRCAQNALG